MIRPGKQIRPNFLRSTSLLYKILPTNLGACKPTFYIIYTSHLRWNSTMRHCFYHTDLGQNAVFHNFAIQIALIQYSGRSKHAWAFSETVKKISKITYTASWFSLLTSAKVDWIYYVYFLFNGFITMCNLQSIWYARHFDYSCKWCSWATENKRHSD